MSSLTLLGKSVLHYEYSDLNDHTLGLAGYILSIESVAIYLGLW